jgi:cation transport ATPase
VSGKPIPSGDTKQETPDRLAGQLVYFALSAAVLTFLITNNLRSMISIIIVAGGRGIAAGTSLAIPGAIGRAARKGAVIKGGIYLEAMDEMNIKAVLLTGAAAGFLDPLIATLIHVVSELTFILNSTRLIAPRERRNPPA